MKRHRRRLASFVGLALTLALQIGGVATAVPMIQGCGCTAPVAFPNARFTITDASTGAPLAGATITATRTNGGPLLINASDRVDADAGTTDASTTGAPTPVTGQYIGWGAADRYTVTVSKPGYQTVTQTVDVTGQGGCDSRTTNVAIALTPS